MNTAEEKDMETRNAGKYENYSLVFHGKFAKYNPQANKKLVAILADIGWAIEWTEEEVWIYAPRTLSKE